MADPTNRILSAIQAHNIRYVRFVMTDNAGLIRAKALHTSALGPQLDSARVGITAAQQALPVMYDGLAPGSGLTPASEVFMRADWSTFTPLPYAPGHARVLADLYDGDQPWAHCPRGFLHRMIAQAGEHGLRLMAAFENEFFLLRSEGAGFAPVDRSVYAQTSSLDRMAPVLDDISAALEAQGVLPELLHAESGPGQFELPVRYAEALTAADQ
ncbi:MAG: glutamine synthetase, partial [Chloroflexi bacterium]|nr:glutamine synthetase [Chloroflexota bacterium]